MNRGPIRSNCTAASLIAGGLRTAAQRSERMRTPTALLAPEVQRATWLPSLPLRSSPYPPRRNRRLRRLPENFLHLQGRYGLLAFSILVAPFFRRSPRI